ncbi:ATP synthase subunit C family protein [Leishmania donovani]|uniref:ATP synthase subunit C family protein n=1 Tax=Leishmania donovani TaxID=5661 RepID=A0A504XA40_LEIDO|nr:ATP synthase subunit C family protein [Leishmania donovani]
MMRRVIAQPVARRAAAASSALVVAPRQASTVALSVQGLHYVGTGLAAIALGGVGLGIGAIFGCLLIGCARQPNLTKMLFNYAILGFALTEAIGLFALMLAFLMLFSQNTVNKDLHAYLAALPEAIGALKGLSNHYRYMSEEMPKFMGFDIACSKMHNLALMLEHGKAVGIERVAAAVQEMFAAEPLVQTVCTSILAAPAPPHPSSIAAASATFTFCMEELDRAVGKVAMRYAAALEEPPNATPGILSDSVRKLVGMTRADTLSKGQRQLAERRRDLERMLRRAQRQLHTEEDIRAALDYTRELDQHLQAAAPKRTDLLLSLPSRKDNFLAAVRSDSEVKKAIQQINLWRDSATTFLVHRQAEDALQCYYLLLAETLTAVNELK